MKKKEAFLKITKVLVASGLVISSVSALSANSRASGLQDSETIKKALEIYFDEPVSQGNIIPNRTGGFSGTSDDDYWQQLSLPIGNSYMGANVYGEIGKEHLTFNHKTLWNGGPSDNRTNYNGGNVETVGNQSMADYVSQVQDKFLNGIDASSDCNQIVGTSDGYGAYQSFGDIYLDFNLSGNPTDYKRALNLNDSLATVDFTLDNTSYHREYLASYPDDVIAMKLTSNGNKKMNFDVSFPIDNDTSTNLQKTVTTNVNNDTITVKGQLNDNQMKLNGKLKVVTNDGTIAKNGEALKVTNATEVTIFVSSGTDYKNEYPTYRTGESDSDLDTRIKDVVENAVTLGYDQVKNNAISDYQEIFNRVELNLGQNIPNLATDKLLTAYKDGSATQEQRRALETMLFQYGRYLQIASSRDGDLPANLQGVWNNRVGDANRVPWGSDYHMNVNLQMNYWPTYSTNMAECGIPLIDYIDSLREPGRITAKTYFGVESTAENPENGFTAHTQNTPFGWTCPGWAFSWGWSPAAVPWILQNCYEYYEYTGDLDYLRTNIYPMLKEEAKLYQQILKEDPNTGRLVTVPAYSPEHGPYTAGNTYEQSLVWQLYKDVTEAAEALGVDSDLVTQWKEIQSKLNPIEIGTDGQIKEWYSETSLGSVSGSESHHRHMSHLLGLFPGDLISVDNSEYLDAAKVSLTDRGDDATGWGMGQRLNAWARVGDGNHAYEIIKAFFASGAYPNLWDSHAPFQIDGNFGYTSGVAEMLMQSNMGYINLLPALSDEWQDGEVSGLVARGNFEVAMAWSDLNLTNATITAKQGGSCSIQYPGISSATVLDQKGNKVNVTVESNDRVTFNTTKNGVYTITDVAEKPVSAPNNAKVYSSTNESLITFDAIVGADRYNIYRSDDNINFDLIATITENQYTDDSYESGYTYKVSATKDSIVGELTSMLKPTDLTTISKMDDRDSLIKYSSHWGDWSDAGQYEGTEKYCDSDGGTLEFYFAGTGLNVIGMKANNTHNYDLYIDGIKVVSDFDTNSSQTQRQQTFSQTNGLTNGIHKAELIVSKGKISLDAFEIIRDVNPNALKIETASNSININDTKSLQLKATYAPAGSSGNGVTWSVKNDLGFDSNIAKISESGLLTVTNTGTVIVTAQDKKDKDLIDEITINVVSTDSKVKFDDRDSSITYSTNWAPWDEDKHEFGTITESTTKDEYFEFNFEGTGLSLYFMKLEASGSTAGANVEVFIDGVSKGLYSTFTTVKGSEPKAKVFEDLTLTNGKHTAKVVVKDCPSEAPSGSNAKVSFDYYEVSKTSTTTTINYESLKTEIKNYQTNDLSLYTSESVTEYQNAYNDAIKLYEVATNQEKVDDQVQALINAYNQLALKDINKDALNKAINDAAKLNKDDYTEASWNKLVTALANANTVKIDLKADQAKVNQATTLLTNAIDNLIKPLVLTQLETQINTANEINLDNYQNDTNKENFESIYKQATSILSNPTSQDEIDQITTKLKEAINNLKPVVKVDKDKLNQLIKDYNELDLTKYNDGKEKDNFTSLLAKANILGEVSQKEVDELYESLQSAYKVLTLKEPIKDEKPTTNENSKPTNSTATGDNVSILLPVCTMAIAMFVIIRKKIIK